MFQYFKKQLKIDESIVIGISFISFFVKRNNFDNAAVSKYTVYDWKFDKTL